MIFWHNIERVSNFDQQRWFLETDAVKTASFATRTKPRVLSFALQLGVPVCSTDVTASDGFPIDQQRWFLETDAVKLTVSQQPRVLSFAFTLQGDPSFQSPKSLMVISLGSIPGRIV